MYIICAFSNFDYAVLWRAKEVIWNHALKKSREYNDLKKTDKRANNDLQNIIHKTKDWAIRNLSPAKNLDWTLLLWKGRHLLLHMRHLPYYYILINHVISHESGKEITWLLSRNSVVISDTDIPYQIFSFIKANL